MAQISKFVRNSLKAQLSATTTGFNDRLQSLATTYGIEPWAVDWTADSTNFLFGRINPALIEESSILTYPLTTIDVLRSQNTNRVKFATFAGPVQAVIDVHHSWPEESVLADFASFLDATEDAMVASLNDQSAQSWPGNLLWNGQVATQRTPIIMAGLGWLQSLSFICNFELIT